MLNTLSRGPGTNLNTDHKFTSQIEDASIGLYWYASRAYDPAIGRFLVPDTIVPSAGNPQSLNRFSYTLNNPLKYVDPSGHDPGDEDPQWQAEFEQVHGRRPNDQDWAERQFSLEYQGSGENGSWTDQDWQAYTAVQDILGGDLLAQIDETGASGADLYTVAGTIAARLDGAKEWAPPERPEGVRVMVGYALPPGVPAWTLGNLIILRPDVMDNRAILMHEYVHVLQYRFLGVSFVPKYATENGFSNWAGVLETPAVRVEAIYAARPKLPPIWEFPRAGGHFYWRAP